MCGIFFSCSSQEHLVPSGRVLSCLARRGPDSQQVVQRKLRSSNYVDTALKTVYYINFVSTVLSLRGDSVVRQPLEDSRSGSLLCWNGEAWKVNGTSISGNDAQLIFCLLLEATNHESMDNQDISNTYTRTLQAVLKVVATISGPFSMVFFDAKYQRIFYGRDVLGRRSLLLARSEKNCVQVSSICDGSFFDVWGEVEANGIYVLNLAANSNQFANETCALKHIPWSEEEDSSDSFPSLVRISFCLAK